MLLKRNLGAGPVVAVLLAKCRNELKTIRKVDIIGIDELLFEFLPKNIVIDTMVIITQNTITFLKNTYFKNIFVSKNVHVLIRDTTEAYLKTEIVVDVFLAGKKLLAQFLKILGCRCQKM